jgi:hypothetical protein
MQKIGQVKTQHNTWDVLWNSGTKEFSVGGKLVGTADTKESALWKAELYAADPFNYKG